VAQLPSLTFSVSPTTHFLPFAILENIPLSEGLSLRMTVWTKKFQIIGRIIISITIKMMQF